MEKRDMKNTSKEANETFDEVLSSEYFQLMNNFRQQNKLCDVIVKVKQTYLAMNAIEQLSIFL